MVGDGRGAGLGDNMALGAILANGLAIALTHRQHLDHAGAKQKDEKQRGHHRPAGTESYVAKNIEDTKAVSELLKKI